MRRTPARWLAALLLAVGGQLHAQTASPDVASIELGRRLYADGVLASGQPLVGRRADAADLVGHAAACIACHRASGMGSVEGEVRIQPITGRYLFPQAKDVNLSNQDGIRGKRLSRAHAAYTPQTLERSLRDGVDADGRNLIGLMPRYALGADDLRHLRAYLAQLSTDYSPGASNDTIRFATVITPDVPPARRKVFLDMLQAAVVTKNSSTLPRKRYMTMAANFVTQTERRWDVQVWELQGDPSTWPEQLEVRLREGPIFALLSGLSAGSWDPVQAFAERHQIPVWFPSVALPPVGRMARALYFDRGARLEAEVLASHFAATAGARPDHVVQVFAPGSAGARAAAAFSHAAQSAGLSVRDAPVGDDVTATLSTVAQAGAGDAVVLWLDASRLEALCEKAPAGAARLFLSRSLAGPAATAPPEPWRARVRVLYPYEMPAQRQPNLSYLHAWLKLRSLPLVDEELQSELFFSLNLMTDILQDLLDNLYRDYLIERTEDMIGKRESSKAEQESRDRRVLGKVARAAVDAEHARGANVMDALDARTAQQRAFGLGTSTGTTAFPRLRLGPGQHFASRGAYVARIDAGSVLVPDSDWIVPSPAVSPGDSAPSKNTSSVTP